MTWLPKATPIMVKLNSTTSTTTKIDPFWFQTNINSPPPNLYCFQTCCTLAVLYKTLSLSSIIYQFPKDREKEIYIWTKISPKKIATQAPTAKKGPKGSAFLRVPRINKMIAKIPPIRKATVIATRPSFQPSAKPIPKANFMSPPPMPPRLITAISSSNIKSMAPPSSPPQFRVTRAISPSAADAPKLTSLGISLCDKSVPTTITNAKVRIQYCTVIMLNPNCQPMAPNNRAVDNSTTG